MGNEPGVTNATTTHNDNVYFIIVHNRATRPYHIILSVFLSRILYYQLSMGGSVVMLLSSRKPLMTRHNKENTLFLHFLVRPLLQPTLLYNLRFPCNNGGYFKYHDVG